MADLLLYIARSLVSDPDQVTVETKESESSITLALHVAEEDMGKVIGKEGRIAKAIRTIIKSTSRNESKPVYVEIA
jgi:predicted RNA-binding protein YlqC (UPF0109 family)